MTIWRMRIACWVTKVTHTHTHTHTLTICNTFCFSTTTTVARTRLSVTLYVHCLSCYCMTKNACTSLLFGLPEHGASERKRVGILHV